eukprot:6107882-Pyramimonas_sp.AAC.1
MEQMALPTVEMVVIIQGSTPDGGDGGHHPVAHLQGAYWGSTGGIKGVYRGSTPDGGDGGRHS